MRSVRCSRHTSGLGTGVWDSPPCLQHFVFSVRTVGVVATAYSKPNNKQTRVTVKLILFILTHTELKRQTSPSPFIQLLPQTVKPVSIYKSHICTLICTSDAGCPPAVCPSAVCLSVHCTKGSSHHRRQSET